jgi:hypothetical protein
MKYIKAYEAKDISKELLQKFIDIQYWYLKNSQAESIIKLDYTSNKICKYTILNLNTYKLVVIDYDTDLILEIENQLERILRPATKDEIQTFKSYQSSNKYNL